MAGDVDRKHVSMAVEASGTWVMRRVLAGWVTVMLAASACAAHSAPIADALRAASADQDACRNAKDRVAAIQACTRLISPGPADPGVAADAYIRRAELLGPSNSDEAIGDLTTALKLNPKAASALRLRARLYAMKNNLDAAMADLNQVIAV